MVLSGYTIGIGVLSLAHWDGDLGGMLSTMCVQLSSAHVQQANIFTQELKMNSHSGDILAAIFTMGKL